MFDKGIDTYVILSQQNRFYFSKVSTSFGCAILNAQENIYITDFRYESYVKSQLKDFTVIISSGVRLMEDIKAQLKRLDAKNIGYEENTLTVGTFQKLQECCEGMELKPAAAALSAKRAVKTEEEISFIYEAQKLAERSLQKVIPRIKIGVTEREVSAEILYEMMTGGAEGTSFDTIVAFGANASMPHYKTGGKKLEKNDLILIDMGVRLNGYCSDMTRTFSLGEPAEQLATIHGIVLEAQNYALKHIKAGMTGKEADSLAREFIVSNGYGKEFGHSLGHGVGIDVHEAPNLSAISEDILLENMVVTVEPGIYVEGLGGVRIEDLIVIKKSGIQNLTDFDKSINI